MSSGLALTVTVPSSLCVCVCALSKPQGMGGGGMRFEPQLHTANQNQEGFQSDTADGRCIVSLPPLFGDLKGINRALFKAPQSHEYLRCVIERCLNLGSFG